MYSVEFTPQAFEDLSKLDRAVSERILKKVEWLAGHFTTIIPQPLKGQFQGMFKLTIGDWRVLYTASSSERLITVHLVGHRSQIYRS